MQLQTRERLREKRQFINTAEQSHSRNPKAGQMLEMLIRHTIRNNKQRQSRKSRQSAKNKKQTIQNGRQKIITR